MNMFTAIICVCISTVYGHGRLIKPTTRSLMKGFPTHKMNAPIGHGDSGIVTSTPTTDSSFVCRGNDDVGAVQAVLTPGSPLTLQWQLDADHKGDCAIYISYDTELAPEDQRFFKIASIPKCRDHNGQDFDIQIPDWLPSASNAILRWGWYALHVHPTIEFYAQCVDVEIAGNNALDTNNLPSPHYKLPGAFPPSGKSGNLFAYRSAFAPFNPCDDAAIADFTYMNCQADGSTGPDMASLGNGSQTPEPTNPSTPNAAPTPEPTSQPIDAPVPTSDPTDQPIAAPLPTPAPVSVPTSSSGNKYYANWGYNNCVNDGKAPSWSNQYDNLGDCCEAWFLWMKQACLDNGGQVPSSSTSAPTAVQPNPTPAPIDAQNPVVNPTPSPSPNPTPIPSPNPTPSPSPNPTPAPVVNRLTGAPTVAQDTARPTITTAKPTGQLATNSPTSGVTTSKPTSPAGDNVDIEGVLAALRSSNPEGVFQYETPTGQWADSDLYKWDDMIEGVKNMAYTGVGSNKLWVGSGAGVSTEQQIKYGLVNVAAFLAQAMQESIRYNACDENNWSDAAVVQNHGGSTYSATSACGQLHQSYQDYTCSAEEDELAGGQMACEVDTQMEMRAHTQASWYGAPPALFCAPKSKVPKAPRWDHTGPWCAQVGGWDYVEKIPADDFGTYLEYVVSGGGCKDYEGQQSGGWKFEGEGCVDGACPGSDAPLFGQPEGRTDVEGCCWWGRGAIQSTGTCNYGKLSFYLGKKGADANRNVLYPNIDFCKNPNAICDPSSPGELKWVAGFFYWLNAVQGYEQDGWNYQENLKAWVDGGMNMGSTGFIDGASGIVNRGCHNPPHCGTGDLHAAPERRSNFRAVLEAMALI